MTIAFLGAHAFAGERMDRSAEFMAYLPISKSRRLKSKLLLAVVVAALIWAINGLVMWLLTRNEPTKPMIAFEFFMPVAATGLALFGVGWCVSSLQSSPTFALSAGIAGPLLTGIGLAIAARTFEIESHDLVVIWYSGICTILGIAGFAFGSWYFLKRVEA